MNKEELTLLKKAGYVQLAPGDVVICKEAWALLSPTIKEGIASQKRKSEWKVTEC